MAAALIDVPFSTSHFAPVTARITPRAHRAAATTRCLEGPSLSGRRAPIMSSRPIMLRK